MQFSSFLRALCVCVFVCSSFNITQGKTICLLKWCLIWRSWQLDRQWFCSPCRVRLTLQSAATYPSSAIASACLLLSNINLTQVISQGTPVSPPTPLMQVNSCLNMITQSGFAWSVYTKNKPGPKYCSCFDFLSLQVQKEQYLNYRRAYFKESTDVFASNSKDPSKTSKWLPQVDLISPLQVVIICAPYCDICRKLFFNIFERMCGIGV